MNIFKSILNNLKVISLNAGSKKDSDKLIDRQILINDLREQLILLNKNKTEFKFIGITSNEFDCIYFAKSDDNFNIEFEAVEKTQLPYFEKVKNFAIKNNYTYEEKVTNDIPYIHIKTATDIDETVELAKQIQSEIFGNNESTRYNIVP